MNKVYTHFSENLQAIIKTGRDSGAKIWLCTIASNLKDCPPFASEAGPANADAEFRAGHAALTAGETNKAKAHFTRARDLDTLRFRADSELNAILRKGADQSDAFIDVEETFAGASKGGVPGAEFFFEHVHFNFEGNYLLARSIAEKSAPGAQGTWLSRDECARRLAFTTWDEFQILDEVVRRIELPPFTHQQGHAERLARLQQDRARVEARLTPESHETWLTTYHDALKQRPDDWVLHENFARLLQRIGDATGAEKSWRRVTELLPHSAAAWYSLGNVLDGQGKGGEALSCFQRALELNPNAVEARNGMGLTLIALGRGKDGIEQYQEALRAKPDFAEARVNLGLALAQRGDRAGAIREYQTVLRQNSNSVAAHLNLGKALLGNGDTNGAVVHYREAVRLKPDNAVARFNLGNALAGEAAVEQFTEAVRLKPDFAEAHYNLGMELTELGRSEAALGHLENAVKLAPGMAEAQFNLGVAYAKQKRFTEAIAAFEAVLQVNPQNEVARRYLEQARSLARPR